MHWKDYTERGLYEGKLIEKGLLKSLVLLVFVLYIELVPSFFLLYFCAFGMKKKVAF